MTEHSEQKNKYVQLSQEKQTIIDINDKSILCNRNVKPDCVLFLY